MSNVLGGLRNNYVGTNATNPVNLWYFNRNPGPTDNKGYQLGDMGLNTVNNSLWYLAALQRSNISNGVLLADWQQIGDEQMTFITNNGTSVPLGGQEFILGGTNILTTAMISPPNTITINLIDSPVLAGSLTVGTNLNFPNLSTAATGQITWQGIAGIYFDALGNAFLGILAGNDIVTGTANTAVGNGSLNNITTGSDNTSIGRNTLLNLTTGFSNVAIGFTTGEALTIGLYNTLIGTGAAGALVSGSENISIGVNSAASFTTDESNNIIIGNIGVVGDNNTIRIGTQGGAPGEQNLCFIAGIEGVNPAGPVHTVVINANGQLGVNPIAGSGIETITPDAGTVANTANINLAGTANQITTTGTLNTTLTFALTPSITIAGNYTTTAGNIVIPATTAVHGQIVQAGTIIFSSFPAGNNFFFAQEANVTLTGTLNSVFGGNGPGSLITTGTSNALFGNAAGGSIQTGSANSCFGGVAGNGIIASSFNTYVGYQAGFVNDGPQNVAIGATSGKAMITATNNTFLGYASGTNTTGNQNTLIGSIAGSTMTAATDNTCVGFQSGGSVTGGFNTFLGSVSAGSMTTGNSNVIIGYHSALALITGSLNIIIGVQAGSAYTSSESNNILIGSSGLIGEDDTIRLGAQSTNTACYIAGIYGQTVNAGTGVETYTDSTGKLGTVLSSARYKDNIKDIGIDSDIISKLRPVSFTYKKDPSYKNYGLIAEEVAQIDPNLVVFNEQGLPETVKYRYLAPMLLNELQKALKRIDALELRLRK